MDNYYNAFNTILDKNVKIEDEKGYE